MTKVMIREVSEAVVRQTAEIMGAESASAKAIADAEKRRQAGENVTFYQSSDSTLLVRGQMPQ